MEWIMDKKNFISLVGTLLFLSIQVHLFYVIASALRVYTIMLSSFFYSPLITASSFLFL